MERFKLSSTSRTTALGSDFVLRSTQTTRLVFRPTIVENQADPKASVRGVFIFQKKGLKDEWEDTEAIPLSQLKKAEGFKLELHSAEVLLLFQELAALYQLYEEQGIPWGETQFVRAGQDIAKLSRMPAQQLHEILAANEAAGSDLLSKLLAFVADATDPAALVSRLVGLTPESLQRLNVAVGLQSMKSALAEWEANTSNPREEFWQETLTRHSFVLEHVFSWPTTIVAGKAYVGGKTVFNRDGGIVDFLVQNRVTRNAALVEIKTPATRLLAGEYRGNVHNLSADLSGSVVQVLHYRHQLQQNYHALIGGQQQLFESFDPRCAVIVGHAAKELRDTAQRASFELFRGQLPSVSVICFDELFEKTRSLINVLESSGLVDETDAIPF